MFGPITQPHLALQSPSDHIFCALTFLNTFFQASFLLPSMSDKKAPPYSPLLPSLPSLPPSLPSSLLSYQSTPLLPTALIPLLTISLFPAPCSSLSAHMSPPSSPTT